MQDSFTYLRLEFKILEKV